MLDKITALLEEWTSELVDAIAKMIALWAVFVAARDRVADALSVLDALEDRALEIGSTLFAMHRHGLEVN